MRSRARVNWTAAPDVALVTAVPFGRAAMLWLVAFILVAGLCAALNVYTRKVAAIRARKGEIDFFFGCVKLIL